MTKTLLLNFVKGILAGLAIGVGGFLYILMTWAIKGQAGQILGSILFSVGLFTVCTFYLSLYTGKIGLVFEKKQEKSFYLSLPIMLVGNAIGAIGLGYIYYAIFKDMEIFERVQAVCNARLGMGEADGIFACVIKSFLCGLCVYLAVKAFGMDRLKPLGICMLVFFVFVFVYCGFEHCIANMFYFSFGNSWVNANSFIDLILCIIFNSLGTIPGVLLFKMVKKDGQKN